MNALRSMFGTLKKLAVTDSRLWETSFFSQKKVQNKQEIDMIFLNTRVLRNKHIKLWLRKVTQKAEFLYFCIDKIENLLNFCHFIFSMLEDRCSVENIKKISESPAYPVEQRIHLAKEKCGPNFWIKLTITRVMTSCAPRRAWKWFKAMS